MNRRSFLGRAVAGLVAMVAGVRIAKAAAPQFYGPGITEMIRRYGLVPESELRFNEDRLGDLTARRVREHNARIADTYGVTGSDEWPLYEHYFPGPGRKSVFPGIVEYARKPLT